MLDELPPTLEGLETLTQKLTGVKITLVHEIRTEDNTDTASYLIQHEGTNFCLSMVNSRWQKLYEFNVSEKFAASDRKILPFHVAEANRKPVHFQVAAIHSVAVSGKDEKDLGFSYRKVNEYYQAPMVTIQEGLNGDVNSIKLSAPEGESVEQVVETLKEYTSATSKNVIESSE